MSLLKYDYTFQSLSDKELKVLDNHAELALKKFVIIYASSEPCVYKIVNHLRDKGILDEYNTKTLDGLAIESYFDATANHKYNQIQMGKLIEKGILNDAPGKWLVIPNMSDIWSPKLAFYFYNELKSLGVIGLIFYSSGPNNLGQMLIQHTPMNILQFPATIYKPGDKLSNDEW